MPPADFACFGNLDFGRSDRAHDRYRSAQADDNKLGGSMWELREQIYRALALSDPAHTRSVGPDRALSRGRSRIQSVAWDRAPSTAGCGIAGAQGRLCRVVAATRTAQRVHDARAGQRGLAS